MPLFLASLLGGLVQIAGTLVGKVLLSLGIGYATYSGVDTSIVFARDAFLSGMSGLPALSVQVAGVMKLGVVVSILTSALVARMTLKGLQSGTVKRMVVR